MVNMFWSRPLGVKNISLFYLKHFFNLCCIIESDGRLYEVAYIPTFIDTGSKSIQINISSA